MVDDQQPRHARDRATRSPPVAEREYARPSPILIGPGRARWPSSALRRVLRWLHRLAGCPCPRHHGGLGLSFFVGGHLVRGHLGGPALFWVRVDGRVVETAILLVAHLPSGGGSGRAAVGAKPGQPSVLTKPGPASPTYYGLPR
ncbi:hypothetical protein ACFPM0_21080 [Pseudonocardia sulfidoxydans]|uniref:hypothetical protein n=1 Tax=Pseudonocardia sulfidoxydans TaxID=54011 RepID=UPI003605D39D